MIPNVTYGAEMAGLLGYLAGPGRSNEHTEQHLVAGTPFVMALHGEAVLDRAEAMAIARALDEPRRLLGVEVTRAVKVHEPATGAPVIDPVTGRQRVERVDANVWHCSLSLAAEDGQLTDEQWGRISTDFVARMGFAGQGIGKADCRWVAVRHGLSKNGNDHVHVAVSRVREDGTKAHVPYDLRLSQRVCRDLERDYGLTVLHERDRELPARGVVPGQREAAQRRGAVEVDSQRLERTVRAAAAASVDEGEFVRRVRQAGVLIRPRYAAGRDDVVAGYSVALRPSTGERVVWHGGGRLARDLTLPRLREEWPDTVHGATGAVAEWQATAKNPWRYEPVNPGREVTAPAADVWQRYASDLEQLRTRMQSVPMTDRVAWAGAARQAAGGLAAWSQRLEPTPGPLAAASRALAQSAQVRAWEGRAQPARVTTSLAGSAVAVLTVGQAGNRTAAELMMLRELVKLSRAVHDMHAAASDGRRVTAVRGALLEQLRPLMREAEFHALPAEEQARQMRLAANRGSTAPTAGRPEAGSAADADATGLTEAEQSARNRISANRAWADGDPVPAPLPSRESDPAAPTAASTAPARRRDDDRSR